MSKGFFCSLIRFVSVVANRRFRRSCDDVAEVAVVLDSGVRDLERLLARGAALTIRRDTSGSMVLQDDQVNGSRMSKKRLKYTCD